MAKDKDIKIGNPYLKEAKVNCEIKARVMTFNSYFDDMKDGDVVEMTLVPGQGTTIVVNGATKGTIEGDDFGEALVNVWVGDSPPTDEFKKGVLGG